MKVVPPKRTSHSYTQSLLAPPEAVLPLLCPVRETEWLHDWDPALVVSASGVAEKDCVFITQSAAEKTFWYTTRYEPENSFIEFVRVTPGLTACRLSIRVAKAPQGSAARITYMHTSLGEKGDAFVDGFTEAAFLDFMRAWEKRINHYLTTGTCLAA